MEGEILDGRIPHQQIENDGGDAGEGEHEQHRRLHPLGTGAKKEMESHDHGHAKKQCGDMLGSEGAPGHKIISFPAGFILRISEAHPYQGSSQRGSVRL